MVLRVAGGAGGGGGGNALTTNPLSQFASTTSAQLRGVISDETGTGTAVFNTSPALAGAPTAPTASQANNSTQIATTAYVDTGLGGKVTLLAAATLGAGTTAITRASHLNRPLSVNQAGATTGTFAATATSGALDGDGFELVNVGAGTFTASGDITAATGFSLTAGPGVTFTALYNAATDAFYSTTPSASAAGGDYSAFAESGYGYVVANSILGTNFNTLSTGSGNPLNSSVAGSVSLSDGTPGYSFRPRVRYTATSGSTPLSAGQGGASDYLRFDDATSLNGRFPFVQVGAISDALTSGRFFIGLAATGAWTTASNTVEISAVTIDKMGIGCDSTDSNLSIIFGDNSGASTKIGLGSGFPASQFVAYSVYIQRNSAGTSFTLIAKNLNSGAVTTQVITSATGTLPRSTQSYHHQLVRSNAANTTAACSCDFMSCTMGRLF